MLQLKISDYFILTLRGGTASLALRRSLSFSSDRGDAVPFCGKKVYIALAALAAGILQSAAFTGEPEPINSAVYAGVNESFKACLEKVSRAYSQEWSAARTKNAIRLHVPLEFKPIDEASKMAIQTRFKRGLNYCKRIRDFALEHAKAEVGEPSDSVPLQTLIAKETEEMLTADVKEMTDALRDVILGPNGPGATNFINMIGVLKELDGYRRQTMAEVFPPH